jgi:hypothetical protein
MRRSKRSRLPQQRDAVAAVQARRTGQPLPDWMENKDLLPKRPPKPAKEES